jgi:indole-3-glycerol phosphate synthase
MILDTIVEDKKVRLEAAKRLVSDEKMKNKALECERKSISFYDALAADGLSVIGEFKKKSPSHGEMAVKVDLTERIRQYNKVVSAISCLTEEDHFNGSVDYLKEIRKISERPIIRKDFIFDPYQVYEAKVIGADCILLIAAILDDDTFKHLYDLAYALGMDVLCEVHDEEELDRMLALDVKILGVNNRNLKDFTIHLDTTERLANRMRNNGFSNCKDGSRRLFVTESGVITDDDLRCVSKAHPDALLIGTALMESDNPGELVAHLKGIYDESK